jgi:hypothetical protein
VRAQKFQFLFLVGCGLSRIVKHQQAFDLVDDDLALGSAVVADIGWDHGDACTRDIDAEVFAAKIETLDVRQEVLECGLRKLLAIEQRRSVLDHLGVMLVGLGGHVHFAFHEDQERGLIAHLALGLHLDAGLFEVLFAGLFVDVVVVFEAGAAAHDDVQFGIDEQVSELAPFGLEEGPILELQPGAVALAHVGVGEFDPEVSEAVHQEHRRIFFGLRHRLQEIPEGAGLGGEQLDAGRLDAGLDPIGAGFGVEEEDRFLEAGELVQADRDGCGGIGLARTGEAHHAALEVG